jgi:MFS family permease
MTATFFHRRSAFPAPTTKWAALGGALEIYDFIIFVFFALTLSQLFFPPEMPEWLRLLQSFGIFVTGYLARPLGGILMAHFADHLGRKRVFSLSILMMALPCLLIGIMPTYAQIGYFAPLILLALRVCKARPGGEVPSAWTFVAEHAPPAIAVTPGFPAGRADLRLPARRRPPHFLARVHPGGNPRLRLAFRSCSAACSA